MRIVIMSNDIYGSKYHYVYQITEKTTNMKYIGVRTSTIEPDHDLGVKYFSSSTVKKFIHNQKMNPNNYIYEILSTHPDRISANIEESRLLAEHHVDVNDMFYNISKSDGVPYCISEMTNAIDSEGNIHHISIHDQKYKSGELKHTLKAKVCVYDESKDRNILIYKDDPRYIQGDLKHINHNMITVVDVNNNVLRVSTTDPRYISGELKMYMTEKFKNSITRKVVVADINGNKYSVDLDDPRYVSGELKSVNSIFITVKDKNDNRYKVLCDDEKYISGELIHWKERWISLDGNIFSSKQICLKFGISKLDVKTRCRSSSLKWKNWLYI